MPQSCTMSGTRKPGHLSTSHWFRTAPRQVEHSVVQVLKQRDTGPEIGIWQQVWERRAPGHMGREAPVVVLSQSPEGQARALAPFPVLLLLLVGSNLEGAAAKAPCLSVHTPPQASQARKKEIWGHCPVWGHLRKVSWGTWTCNHSKVGFVQRGKRAGPENPSSTGHGS